MRLKPPVHRRNGVQNSGFAGSTRSSPLAGAGQSGLTLLEIMVASALLAIIMLGLMAMFGQTQRAYHGSIRQVDVLEGARTVLDMMARDLSQISVATDPAVTNLYAQSAAIGRPNPALLPNEATFLQEFFLLTGEYNQWESIGYYIWPPDTAQPFGAINTANAGMGTLYKRWERVPFDRLPMALYDFINRVPGATDERIVRPVIEGVVHLRLWPYDAEGNLLLTQPDTFAFASNSVPAYIELEIALAEPQLVEQIAALPDNVLVRSNYLAQRPHQVHVFRQKIPIRSALSQ